MTARKMTETKTIAGLKMIKGEVVLIAEDLESMTIITSLNEVILCSLTKPLTTENYNKLLTYSRKLKVINEKL